MRRRITRFCRRVRNEQGSSTLEMSLIAPLLLLLVVGAIDFGRAWYMSIEVTSASEAGALYGIKNPADLAGMQSATVADASDISGLSAVAVSGCECPDGTSVTPACSAAPSCTDNYVNYVDVTATATYNFMLSYPGFPPSLTFNSESRLRVGGD
jgi:Flp pilus assembly protein TadG